APAGRLFTDDRTGDPGAGPSGGDAAGPMEAFDVVEVTAAAEGDDARPDEDQHGFYGSGRTGQESNCATHSRRRLTPRHPLPRPLRRGGRAPSESVAAGAVRPINRVRRSVEVRCRAFPARQPDKAEAVHSIDVNDVQPIGLMRLPRACVCP